MTRKSEENSVAIIINYTHNYYHGELEVPLMSRIFVSINTLG